MDTTQTSASRETAPAADIVRRRRVPWMAISVLAVVAVVATAALYWDLVLRFEQTTDDAYVGGDVTVLAPKVDGFVDRILVADNQRVKAGDVLVRLDARDYDAKLAKANAEVDSARAAVAELEAKQRLQLAVIRQRVADRSASAAELSRASSDKVRYRELVVSEAVSNQIVERADADYAKAKAGVARSDAALLAGQRQLDVLGAQLADASARVKIALAAKEVAALNVEYTTIRSPVDGYVGNRTSRLGMLAKVGAPLLTIVPASGLWIDANFKEDQLKQMHAGDRADVSLDSSSSSLHGRVDSLAPATGATFSVLPAENATGNFTKIVQRVPVRVYLDPQPGLAKVLRAGLSAVVTVHTDRTR
ncbi:hemolysin D [Trinickia dabaoshanensis]|uniref:Hemolysin D n=1 Tax=Trinickia dabaoshanensis TaxID=564714 RepID=A0A2N7VB17_9BURK|nr:HlyD family secretion protein [Trinickia dabaoshanensis]PMS14356.1 hemolysin D [Trinickia dabaoshanensis]